MAFPAALSKDVDDHYYDLDGYLDGLAVKFVAFREEVCERVVVGTREVTRTTKDPELLAQLPDVTVTETEEVVEWRCSPLLAAVDGGVDGA